MSPFDAFGTGAPSASENKWSKRLQDGHSPDDIGVAIGQGRVRPVEFLIFDTATKRVNDSLGINSLTRSPLRLCLAANNAHPMLHQISSSLPPCHRSLPARERLPAMVLRHGSGNINRASGHKFSAASRFLEWR